MKWKFSDKIFILGMDVSKKKVCQYGAKCYRKNQAHLRDYFHSSEAPKQDGQDKEKLKFRTNELKKKKRQVNVNAREREIDKNTSSESEKRKKPSKNLTNQGKKARKNEGAAKENSEENKSNSNSSEKSDDSENDIKSNSWTYIKAPVEAKEATKDTEEKSTEEIIKSYYLVDMPPDFYSFFKFCEFVNKSEPLSALKPFGLNLVGPFEIISGKDINLADKSLMVCHWRYYYDPPEFQTVLASQSGFHMGYWRDDPQEEPPLVASNTSKDCSFKIEGGNIFGAVYHYLTEFVKTSNPFRKTEAARFQVILSKWAEENKHSLEKLTENAKNRTKNINSRTFHGLGIVVPVEKKTDVGYRPLIESDANLKKICQLIMDAEDKDEEEILMEKLQPLITFANIANDECDFGNSLELGIDLFCMGSTVFHSVIEHLLTTAYTLLKRSEFGEIIRIHLKNRKKGNNMSVL